MIRTEGSKGQGVEFGKVIAFQSVKRRSARLVPRQETPQQRDVGAATHLRLVPAPVTKTFGEVGRGYPESRDQSRPSIWLALGFLVGYVVIVALAASRLADSLTWAGSAAVLVAVHVLIVAAARRYRVGQVHRAFEARPAAVARRPRTGRAVFRS